ncbi:MAG: double zinc ribbon domain-containing protein [Candidatus Rokuibacteriota bacterium]
MRCPACARDNRTGVRFCEECGAALELVCAACGARLPGNPRVLRPVRRPADRDRRPLRRAPGVHATAPGRANPQGPRGPQRRCRSPQREASSLRSDS